MYVVSGSMCYNQAMLLQVGVKVLLQNEAGEYLLLHRSVESYPQVEGKWDIAGGRIDPGVPLFENLQREVLEETGLILEEGVELLAAQDILLDDKHVVRLTYKGSAHGEVFLGLKEHDKYVWKSLAGLRSMDDLDPYLQELVEQKLQ